MQPDFVQQALKALRPDTPNWYGWDVLSDGHSWENAIVIQDGVTKPTKEEFDAVYNELVNAYPMQQLRSERNQRLAETDWWASSDLTMTAAQKDYRQALRDITTTYSSLEDVVWPEKP